ncbi:YdcF family protein [Polaromonas sp. YR568]|uniref:YdcF family protein n=1 Tax=Polaromonas sp. YR568 TaxID=1855301 RepID=UPI0020C8F511|nr:YdcF family protein [Polaromonas sp. YR568]
MNASTPIPDSYHPGPMRWLLLAIGILLLIDCIYLVTVKVTHLGVIVPAVISAALIALSLFIKPWQAWLRGRRWRLLAWRLLLTGFFLWLASLVVFFVAMQRLQPSGAMDADPRVIVVLGSSTPNGQASPVLVERLKLAYSLAGQHPRALVVVSGGTDFRQEISEARVMADYLVGLGLDAARITLEDQSTSTYENLVFSARLLEAAGVKRDVPMVLVTSDFHTARAGWIAEEAGWSNVRAAGSLTPLYMRYNAWTREYFACLSGWLLREY